MVNKQADGQKDGSKTMVKARAAVREGTATAKQQESVNKEAGGGKESSKARLQKPPKSAKAATQRAADLVLAAAAESEAAGFVDQLDGKKGEQKKVELILLFKKEKKGEKEKKEKKGKLSLGKRSITKQRVMAQMLKKKRGCVSDIKMA